MKDTELTRDIANGIQAVNRMRSESGKPEDEHKDIKTIDNTVKVTLAQEAVREALDENIHDIAIIGALPENAAGASGIINTQVLVNEAARVGSDYDEIQRLAKAASEARLNGAEFLNLSSNDFTIALAEAPVYRKAAIVKARKAVPGEVVVTVTPDGIEEGRNTAGEDDYVVTGANGADFILPGEKFNKLYEETEEQDVFQSRGMARIIDNPTGKKIGILAPWGEMQYGDSEAKIAVQYDPQNPEVVGTDRYILDKTEFSAYKEVE